MSNARTALAAVLVGAATIVLLITIALPVFFNPVWIRLGQERAQADAWTGWPMETVTEVTNSVLRDVLLGPPAFDQTVDGEPVFNEREQGHLRDVRTVTILFALVALIAAVWLVVAARRSHGARWFWQGVAGGALALAGGVVGIGLLALVAFDQVFEVFHRILFPEGSYNFDPSTERMVQLFPMQFWFETSIALGLVLLVLAGVTLLIARPRLRARLAAEGAAGGSEIAPDSGGSA